MRNIRLIDHEELEQYFCQLLYRMNLERRGSLYGKQNLIKEEPDSLVAMAAYEESAEVKYEDIFSR